MGSYVGKCATIASREMRAAFSDWLVSSCSSLAIRLRSSSSAVMIPCRSAASFSRLWRRRASAWRLSAHGWSELGSGLRVRQKDEARLVAGSDAPAVG